VPQFLALRFFDLDVHVRSDDKAHLDLFARMYTRFRSGRFRSGRFRAGISRAGRFQVTGASPPARPPVECAVWTRPDNPWGRPVLVLAGEAHPLRDAGSLAPYVYQSILCDILARVRSHVLIHAGAVTRGGQGIVLAADSFHGKTTLVLELVRRGFQFLSDETAALGRADRRVHPFPRSLSVRPGTLERAGFPELAAGAPSWGGKQLLDIEQIRPGCLGEAAPVGHVVILHDPEDDREDGSERELGVLLDGLDEDLLAAVGQIEGVADVRTETAHGYPLLQLRATRRTWAFSQIEALCQARGIWILDVLAGPAGAPNFTAPARLEAIPRSQAVVELLRRFQGGHKSAIMEEFGGRSTRLFMELAAIVGQADCWRLCVGPLHEMADLVEGLVDVSKTRET
jgi:hypothetical protein